MALSDDLGRYIATRITTRLGQSKKFSVTERQRLTQVLAELKMSMSALVNPEQAKQLQKMVGVDALIVGTITDLGKQVDIDARLIDIEANQMIWSDSVTIDKDPTLEMLSGRGQGRTAEAPAGLGGTDGNLMAELRENQPDWVINGKNYNLVDSQLASQGFFTAYVKNAKWNNYAVEFDMKKLTRTSSGLGILMRRQSDTDYVALLLGTWFEIDCGTKWAIVKRGQETVVVGTEVEIKPCAGHYRVEVDGNKYKLFKDGNEVSAFSNSAFGSGGVGLKVKDNLAFALENFKVVRLETSK